MVDDGGEEAEVEEIERGSRSKVGNIFPFINCFMQIKECRSDF